jgi:hypothetical protein
VASFNKFNIFVADVANKVHNLGSDQLVIALSNTLPLATNAVLADITQISYTNLSSRNVTTTSCAQTSGVLKLILVDLVLTASGAVGPFQYIVLYNSTAGSGNLIGWFDNGSPASLVNLQTFTVDFSATDGVLQIT